MTTTTPSATEKMTKVKAAWDKAAAGPKNEIGGEQDSVVDDRLPPCAAKHHPAF
jgi:hypothetical protein